MADVVTMLNDLINPQVMADMVSAKLSSKVRILPYAKLDTTLKGRAGDTITLPKFEYIGDAVDVAEGEEIPTRKLTVVSKNYTIKKAGIGGILTDEAVLSGHGNPVGELNSQMANSIASKCDADALDELYKATKSFTATTVLGYEAIVNAQDLFEEEDGTEKVIFVHPKQVTQLRLDPNFISREKYGNEVMVSGEIGMVAGCRVKPSRKVKVVDGNYQNPIVKLESEAETDEEAPALTYYVKRDVNIEKERIAKKRLTEITGDEMYVVALTNEMKVVILKTLEVPAV